MSAHSIAVVMAAYNGERFIAAALTSVLAQRFPAAEVIVVDDGSNDSTREIVRSFGDRVRLITQANAGEAAARNHGIAVATTDLVTTIDQDDLWHPEHLAVLLEAYRAAGGGDRLGVVPMLQQFMVDGQTDRPHPDALAVPAGDDPQAWLDARFAPTPQADPLPAGIYAQRSCGTTMLAPRAFVVTCGGFPVAVPGVGDYALLANAARIGRLVAMSSPSVYYRAHPSMASYSYDMVQRSLTTRVHLSGGGRLPIRHQPWDAYLVGELLHRSRPLLPAARTALGYWALLRPPTVLTLRVAAKTVVGRFRRR